MTRRRSLRLAMLTATLLGAAAPALAQDAGQLLYERGREVGVTVIADIPALHIAPPLDGPRSWRDLLFATLAVKGGSAKGNEELISKPSIVER